MMTLKVNEWKGAKLLMAFQLNSKILKSRRGNKDDFLIIKNKGKVNYVEVARS